MRNGVREFLELGERTEQGPSTTKERNRRNARDPFMARQKRISKLLCFVSSRIVLGWVTPVTNAR